MKLINFYYHQGQPTLVAYTQKYSFLKPLQKQIVINKVQGFLNDKRFIDIGLTVFSIVSERPSALVFGLTVPFVNSPNERKERKAKQPDQIVPADSGNMISYIQLINNGAPIYGNNKKVSINV